jgi:protein SCO1/2
MMMRTTSKGTRAGKVASWLGLLFVITLCLASCGGKYEFNGTAYDPPRPAPAITGVNWDGTPFEIEALQGKATLIFFGYTYCPDVCPLTMAELRQVHEQLAAEGHEVEVVFVSTDPERDTPERLAQYIAAFNPEFYGVHVPLNELPEVKKSYGVYSEKVTPTPDADPDDYLIEHSGYIFVVDPGGNLRVAFGYSLPKDGLVADVKYILGS